VLSLCGRRSGAHTRYLGHTDDTATHRPLRDAHSLSKSRRAQREGRPQWTAAAAVAWNPPEPISAHERDVRLAGPGAGADMGTKTPTATTLHCEPSIRIHETVQVTLLSSNKPQTSHKQGATSAVFGPWSCRVHSVDALFFKFFRYILTNDPLCFNCTLHRLHLPQIGQSPPSETRTTWSDLR
jgi:hypothetical protein